MWKDFYAKRNRESKLMKLGDGQSALSIAPRIEILATSLQITNIFFIFSSITWYGQLIFYTIYKHQ